MDEGENSISRRNFLQETGRTTGLAGLPAGIAGGYSAIGGLADDFLQPTEDSYEPAELRGVNIAYKEEGEFLPPESKLDESDMEHISSDLNMNFVRLAIYPAAVMPEEGAVDHDYLDEVADFASKLEDNGLDVVLDMHQDLFSYRHGGDGMPDWMVELCDVDWRGYDYSDVEKMWQENYLKTAVSDAFESFWNNRNGLQGFYRDMWKAVSNRFSETKNVIGYEIMNEPVPGLDISPSELPDRLEKFEEETLTEFYSDMAQGIREEDRHTPIWIEPSAASFNLGLPTSLGEIEDPQDNMVFSYHNYAPILGDIKHRLITWNAMKARNKLGTPIAMTEFSGPTGRETLEYMTESGDGWAWWQYTEQGGGWASEAEQEFIGHWGLKNGKGKRHEETLSKTPGDTED